MEDSRVVTGELGETLSEIIPSLLQFRSLITNFEFQQDHSVIAIEQYKKLG